MELTLISRHAKANEKDNTLSVLVECNDTDRLFIARLTLSYFIEEFKHRMGINEDDNDHDYNEDYFDKYNDYIDYLDDIIMTHSQTEENELDIRLYPYYDPRKIVLEYTTIRASNVGVFENYGFVELSDFDEKAKFIY